MEVDRKRSLELLGKIRRSILTSDDVSPVVVTNSKGKRGRKTAIRFAAMANERARDSEVLAKAFVPHPARRHRFSSAASAGDIMPGAMTETGR